MPNAGSVSSSNSAYFESFERKRLRIAAAGLLYLFLPTWQVLQRGCLAATRGRHDCWSGSQVDIGYNWGTREPPKSVNFNINPSAAGWLHFGCSAKWLIYKTSALHLNQTAKGLGLFGCPNFGNIFQGRAQKASARPVNRNWELFLTDHPIGPMRLAPGFALSSQEPGRSGVRRLEGWEPEVANRLAHVLSCEHVGIRHHTV